MKYACFMLATTCVLIALMVGTLLSEHYYKHNVEFPSFPEAQDNTPQVLVPIDPDFSYRTGDLIPVNVFVKQASGTKLDVKSLVLEGDFEIAEQPAGISKIDNADGSVCYRVPLVLQSLATKNKLVMEVSLTFKRNEERKHQVIHLPAMQIYTSITWDGREELKEKVLSPESGRHWLWTIGSLSFGVIGLITLLVIVIVRRNLAKARANAKTTMTLAREEFVRLWQTMESGNWSHKNYLQIEHIIRDICEVQSLTLAELELSTCIHKKRNELRRAVSLCNEAIYRDRVLTSEEKTELHDVILEILKEE